MSSRLYKEKIIPLEFDIFIGMDVDKRSIAITILDNYTFCKSFKIPYDPDAVVKYMKKHFPEKRIAFAYESGPTGYGLHDRIIKDNYPCLVVAPSTVPTARGSRVKTNRLDSKKIAKSLRGSQLKGIRVPYGNYRALRHLTQLRNSLVKQCRAYKCRIKALLLVESIKFPETPQGSQWSKAVLHKLETMQCSRTVRFKLDRLLENLTFSQAQALKTQKEIRHLCQDDEELANSISYLMSVPGIGWILASNLLARIGDWRLLRNAHELGAFLGLTPSEDSTGDEVNKGNITGAGDSTVRNMLIEGSWAAIRKDPELKAFYLRIYNRNPRAIAARKAIVAVARKITSRVCRVLKDQRPYVIRNLVNAKNKTSSEKGRPSASGDDSTLRRTGRYIIKRRSDISYVPTVGSIAR